MELHPIENDDGNVAEEVLQAVEENQQADPQVDPEALQDQPSPAMVYDRIILLEETLREAWEEFKDRISADVNRIEHDLNKMEKAVNHLSRLIAGHENYSTGDTVVVLDIRKFGRIKKVTKMYVDVIMDDDNKVIRKKKNLVKRIITRY